MTEAAATPLLALYAVGVVSVLIAGFCLPASAQTNAWQWQSALVPKARVFEGLWSEYFQIEPALHLVGIPYTPALIGELGDSDMPDAQDAVIVLGI